MHALASEFPNDNPALHRGVSWVCLDVTGPASAVTEAMETEHVVETGEPLAEAVAEVAVVVVAAVAVVEVAAVAQPEVVVPAARISGIVALGQVDHGDLEDDDEGIVVEELPPLDETACLEGVTETATMLPPASDDAFVVLVSALADVAIGAGSPHVASLLPALLLDGKLEHAMPAEAAEALAEAGIACDGNVLPAFVAQTHAWRAILAGTSDDFGACGNAMLDEWAAELLARLLGAPSRATALRRDLRAHGVAAFGLVEAA